jgi:hypothetical protein
MAQGPTVHRDVIKKILTRELGLGEINFHCNPYELTGRQKIFWVKISQQLLPFRGHCSERKLCNIFSGDETSICADNL